MKRFIAAIYPALLCITALIMFTAPLSADQQVPVHVAVLQFRPSGASASHAALFAGYLEMELIQKKEIVLLERGQIKKTYSVKEANRYSCRDSSCAVLAGRELSADYVILGDVTKNGRYTIEARVVSVEMEKIVYTCSVHYDREDEAKTAAGELARKMMVGLMDASHDPRPGGNGARLLPVKPVFIDLFANLAVFQPFDTLGRLIGTGAGFNCGFMVSGMGGPVAVRRITAGFDTGLLYAPGIVNSNDSGMIAPFSFSLGYMVPVVEKIYFLPSVSFGFTYLQFNHEKGDGFDMEDGSSAWTIDPHFRVTVLFGRPIVHNIRLEISTAFWVLFESPSAPIFLTVHMGLTCRFETR